MLSGSQNHAQVYIALGATDMRKSINGLSIIVEEELGLDLFTGNLFAFCNRNRDIVKILYWDHNGFCVWKKRLEKDKFRWPESEQEVMKDQQIGVELAAARARSEPGASPFTIPERDLNK